MRVRIENTGEELLDPMCFIRAPKITKVGEEVQVLARIVEDGAPCAVKQNNLIALTFHPEVNGIEHFHKLAFFND